MPDILPESGVTLLRRMRLLPPSSEWMGPGCYGCIAEFCCRFRQAVPQLKQLRRCTLDGDMRTGAHLYLALQVFIGDPIIRAFPACFHELRFRRPNDVQRASVDDKILLLDSDRELHLFLHGDDPLDEQTQKLNESAAEWRSWIARPESRTADCFRKIPALSSLEFYIRTRKYAARPWIRQWLPAIIATQKKRWIRIG